MRGPVTTVRINATRLRAVQARVQRKLERQTPAPLSYVLSCCLAPAGDKGLKVGLAWPAPLPIHAEAITIHARVTVNR